MITLGSTTPSTGQAGAAGRIFAQHVVLSGAPAGSYFSKIRAKMRNASGSVVNARVLVYSGTTLVDWAAFTIPASTGATIYETNLAGAVTVTDGTYKIGVQVDSANGTYYITTGTADTTAFTTGMTYGSAPPNPWTPGSTFGWSLAVAADVDVAVSAPVAAFSGTPLTGDAPLSVTFTDASTNTPTSWAWDFGDAGTSTTQNPSHNYTSAGSYTVELDATNAGGTDNEAKVAYVTITEVPRGICLAPDDGALVAAPTWERIDQDYNVRSWAIDRGRQNEMSRTDTGTASIELVDRTGDFDPTNPDGAFFGRLTSGKPMGPMVQAKIDLQHPVTEAWSTLFRGFIASIQWVPYQTEEHANVTLELVDGLALLAACEMAPDGSFGHAVIEGNIVYNEDADLDAVQTRIGKVLDEFGWAGTLRSIFTGNVGLQGGGLLGAGTYAPRSTPLSVIQDAADAEFPDMANVYISGPRGEVGDAPPGSLTFHGRYARFHPDVVEYDIRTFQLGDDTAAALDEDVVRVSPPLVASLDDTMLYTSALATPNGVDAGDIAGQYVTDITAALDKGLRTWSAENLLTLGGEGDTTALEEVKLMADYIRDNYQHPVVRVGQLTVKARRPDSLNGPATWTLLTAVDISDIVHLTTTHAGGGGFNDDFYVEGIHYQARPGGSIPYIELTLDVSPRGLYDGNPFAS